MSNLKIKKVLGLDIGSNSIGFSFLELTEKDNEIIFNELTSNSIIFSEPSDASDRRDARSSRRRNERKSARNKNARNLFIDFNIAEKSFLTDTTNYLNDFNLKDNDVYNIRKKAILGANLTKEEFVLATYSILTDRGYNNMFSISNEDGVINEAVTKNSQEYLANEYKLPSMVLTKHRDDLKNTYQNIPIRNKKDDYSNSLDRDMHIEEFQKVVLSQAKNKNIFKSVNECESFIVKVVDDKFNAFYQRPLKSFEDMVDFCQYYDKFNPKGSYKKTPLSNIRNIELTLRQKIDNHECINSKTDEVKKLTKDEINKVINFWINTPSSNEINATNIFKSVGLKDIKLNINEKSSQTILDIKAHRNILEILNKYNIDFQDTQNSFYNKILLELHYFKNNSSRVENIEKLIEKYNFDLEDSFIQELAVLNNMDGFASFSLEFTNEVLNLINKENKTHHEALKSLGYFSKYLKMPSYDYLPPLEPTKADIKWLQSNISYFDTTHLFYQPMMSPKVKRVISILRKLINDIIKQYGKIDEIRIETAKDTNLDSKKEEITKKQSKDKAKNDEAKRLLKSNGIYENSQNTLRAKLYIEQSSICLYSGENITLDEIFDANETEVEHFIPRSKILVDGYKNKILVKKKDNQDKGSQHPLEYFKKSNQWENFKGRVESKIKDKRKIKWLTDENIINSVMEKDYWKSSYLNDTRSAIKTIQKYLNHYLYPNEILYGKDEKRSIFSVSGRAISELKYMWGIHTVMPKNEDDKKDRNTNYHHTLDAFAVALCSNGAINTLHSHFKKKENKFKARAEKKKLTSNIPKSVDGTNVVEYLKSVVTKYETNKLYVCPYNKRKTNMKGFKDGNLKLYVTKDKNDNAILAEMEKISIDSGLLTKPKPKGQGVVDRSDKEVFDNIKSIQDRLDSQKQKNIIDAIEVYAKELINYRDEIKNIKLVIKELIDSKKTKKDDSFNEIIQAEIEELKDQENVILKQQQGLKCCFTVKNGKKQIVKTLKLYKAKISKKDSEFIIFPKRINNKIERLTVDIFNEVKKRVIKEPFNIKANETTLNIDIYSDKKQGQLIGLNYFSSIANNNIKSRFKKDLNETNNFEFKIYKNDILGRYNKDNILQEIYTSNGGGNVTSGNNILKLNTINKNSKDLLPLGINKDRIIKKLNIDFFGNITDG